MIWGLTDAERTSKWNDWFAWHPVKLDDGRWAWLERLQFKCNSYGDPSFKYRPKGQPIEGSWPKDA